MTFVPEGGVCIGAFFFLFLLLCFRVALRRPGFAYGPLIVNEMVGLDMDAVGRALICVAPLAWSTRRGRTRKVGGTGRVNRRAGACVRACVEEMGAIGEEQQQPR